MHFALFCHSIVSDWDNGAAHFLRGMTRELMRRGHRVTTYEPENGRSRRRLTKAHGTAAQWAYKDVYPEIEPVFYHLKDFDHAAALRDVDVVLVHEWADFVLVERLNALRKTTDHFRLLWYDNHHRSVSARAQYDGYQFDAFDLALPYGESLKQVYEEAGWFKCVGSLPEAADPSVFKPMPEVETTGDIVWIGNWGGDERAEELFEYFIRPVQRLGLRATMFGVDYPKAVLEELHANGIQYKGWLPNFRVPEVFAAHRMTLHIPRRYYLEQLPGIPTIRTFEALACGIPLISSPWRDTEGHFEGVDAFWQVKSGEEAEAAMQYVLKHPKAAREKATQPRAHVLQHHTYAQRVNLLLNELKTLA